MARLRSAWWLEVSVVEIGVETDVKTGVETDVKTGVEIGIEIGVWWVWWYWHGGQFLGLVADIWWVWWFCPLILTMAMTGIWVGWVAKGLLGLLGF